MKKVVSLDVKYLCIITVWCIVVLMSGCTEKSPSPNQTLFLDGQESYVEIPDNDLYQVALPGFTLECWLRVLELPPRAYAVISNIGRYPGGGYQIQVNHKGIIQFEFRGTDQIRGLIQSSQPLKPGRWYHIACVYYERDEDSFIQIYLNASLQDKKLMKGSRIQYQRSSPILYLGTNIDREIDARDFIGEIDEVMIWDIPLNCDEIEKCMNGSLTGSEKGLAGYWNFNGDQDTICLDLTDRRNPGELKGNARKVEGIIPGSDR